MIIFNKMPRLRCLAERPANVQSSACDDDKTQGFPVSPSCPRNQAANQNGRVY